MHTMSFGTQIRHITLKEVGLKNHLLILLLTLLKPLEHQDSHF